MRAYFSNSPEVGNAVGCVGAALRRNSEVRKLGACCLQGFHRSRLFAPLACSWLSFRRCSIERLLNPATVFKFFKPNRAFRKTISIPLSNLEMDTCGSRRLAG